MKDPRAYSAGTRSALAYLSRGRCYNPDCERSQPIIQFSDGEPYTAYDIAHIRDARPGNRYVPDMTDDERRAFANLVLLCRPCHTMVDKGHPADYPIERLAAWKRQREGQAGGDLAAVGSLDSKSLAELLRAAVRSAIGNPDLVVQSTGGVISITPTAGGLPRLLPLEPATAPPGPSASPTRLIRARSGLLPFTVHQGLRAALLDWCLAPTAFSGVVVAGRGGAGKTRLAVQLCEDLGGFGWVRGLLCAAPEPAELEALVGTPTPRLVAIDYAEARADQVASWLPRLAAVATGEHPVRVLLLVRARRGGDRVGALRSHGELFDALLDDMGVYLVDEKPLSADSRRDLFLSAASAFAARAEPPLGIPYAPALDARVFATPLLVVLKAYLEVHGTHAPALTTSELLEEMLAHEDRYWQATGPGAPADRVLRRRVVALATLAGAADEEDAAERLTLVPDLVGATEERRRALARWANSLYPGPYGWWNPLEPDLVGEHLVASTYGDKPDVLAGVLIDRPEILIRPLALYARAVPEHPQLAETLGPVLGRELLRLCRIAVDQAASETDRGLMLGDATVAAVLARCVAVTDLDIAVLTSALDEMPPRFNLVLTPLAIVMGTKLVSQLRPLALINPAAYEHDLAFALNNLSVRLGDAGRHLDGLAAIEEAVAVYRPLAATNSLAHESKAATSLHNLAVRLAALGRDIEALAAIQEAVAVCRRLAATNPLAHEPDFAMSLDTLSGRLAKAGRRDEGLAASEEAVAVYRRLAATNRPGPKPADYEPGLAASLNSLSDRLAEAGRRDESLAASQEAVTLYRRLAGANPAAFEPVLARSLNNLSIRLAQAGSRDVGLAASEEAVAVHRRLASANPAAYEPYLAASLNNLSLRLGEAGRHDEGLAASEEAVAVYRRVTSVNPAAYEPDLAASLNNLSMRLGEAGRHDEGLAASEEAVAVYRRVTSVNPAAYEPDLATSLDSLSIRLGAVGRRDEGLAADEEAVAIYRRLAASNPAPYEPVLAMALNNLSIHMGVVGRHDEGLATNEEAVAIYRRLAAANPAAHAPDLAASLHNLSIRLGELERHDEGLAADEEAVSVAVAIYRRLAAANPALYEPALAASLGNLSIHMGEVGRHDEGLAADEEAVAIYRRLAAANPALYEPALAASLGNLSIHMGEVGRHDEGLAADEEAVAIYRRLAASNPAPYEPALAASLHNLSVFLGEVGRHDEGMAANDEALAIHRRLAASELRAHRGC